MATKTNPYSGMTPEQLRREQERINADIDKSMRGLKIAGIVFFVAIGVMAISATIALLLQFHIIH